MNKPALILLTAEYPYGKGETFLENELPFLARSFDEIHILARSGKGNMRSLPAGVKAMSLQEKSPARNEKPAWFRYLFHSVFIREIISILLGGRFPSKLIHKIALKSLMNACDIRDFMTEYCREHDVRPPVILYSYWADDAALAAVLLKKHLPDATAISRMHRWDLYQEGHPGGYLPYRLTLLSTLDAAILISEHGQRYLQEQFQSRISTPLMLSRLGIINKEHGVRLTSGKLRIVSCSLLIPRKRVHLIIEALALLGDIPVCWDHLGGGAQEDELNEYAARMLGGKTHVEYKFHGWRDNSYIRQFYRDQSPDIFINTSSDEGIPVSIMEAFSFGIPAIATDAGGTREIVRDSFNGFLLPNDISAQNLAFAIQHYHYLKPDQKISLREKAHQTWADQYDAEKNYPAFIEQIRGIAGLPPAIENPRPND